jgi:N-acyl-D-aspartate/D-glutamate deacylase
VAKRLGKPYEKVMIDDLGYGGPEQAHFLMSAPVQDLFITAEHICVSTDGAPGSNHPRSYGSFIKILEDYVGPTPKMTLERAIHKMSGLAAQIVGITDRGRIAPRQKADLLILDPGALHSRATWLQPTLHPAGISLIVVNGAIVYEDGRFASARHGRVLKKSYAGLQP